MRISRIEQLAAPAIVCILFCLISQVGERFLHKFPSVVFMVNTTFSHEFSKKEKREK